MERVGAEGSTLKHPASAIQASLDGSPGDRVNLSCAGVSHPIRWAWAPSFPACKGLSKGRRPILWASSSGTPTVPPVQPFAARLRALDPGIRRLELLLSAGDSGTFFCRGRHEDESRTVLHVLGDRADCRAPGPIHGSVYHQLLILLLVAGLALALGALGVVWWMRRRSSPHPLPPLPRFAPLVKAEPQSPVKEEEPKTAGDLDQEPVRAWGWEGGWLESLRKVNPDRPGSPRSQTSETLLPSSPLFRACSTQTWIIWPSEGPAA
ncbi:megakaryocyte and platelet inhibitory receptor G6b isoform X2 [Manis pentadactyla]|uniref:megakaryocyte and platelet inhibitory receptor G6b isoform X2 n=1 Tax=Manis pentadactyla TaxID=143292 RepID=UPI00255CC52B|nr:megakaryocyte and platelet inhibitory receptor G6b isoform X2 [Manis pentadactyla]